MANRGTLRLSLIDTHGTDAPDAPVRVTIRHHDGSPITRANVDMTAQRVFDLPAFPQTKAMYGMIEPSRFRTREIPVFMLTHGETVTRRLTVFRRPAEWRAKFEAWAAIQVSAADLATVLGNSPDVHVRGWKTYPLLTGATYEALGTDPLREELPKATLLNVYSRLSTMNNPTAGRPWFSYVQRILELSRERTIARVDEAMGKAVQAIRGNMKHYSEYKLASADLHWPNFPSKYGVLKKDMFSIKSKHDKGNVQLTLAPGTDENGHKVLLLDADIDENGDWFKHATDVFIHKFTGGTHPFDIHDRLAIDNAALPVGYRLV